MEREVELELLEGDGAARRRGGGGEPSQSSSHEHYEAPLSLGNITRDRRVRIAGVAAIVVVALVVFVVVALGEFSQAPGGGSAQQGPGGLTPFISSTGRWTAQLEADSIAWHELPSFSASAMAGAQKGYYRRPALHGNTVLFVSEGDIWRTTTAGGLAVRLTSHDGFESHPVISPDGKLLAFSGQYQGVTELYVMPVSGGLPRRVTFEGSTIIPVAWRSQDTVVVRTRAFSTLPDDQLAIVDINTLGITRVPLSQALDIAYFRAPGSPPEDACFAFTRVTQSSHTKRYKGGTAPQLWRYCPDRGDASRMSSYIGTSKNPMWYNFEVLFLSDRETGIMNIWAMDEQGGGERQVTDFDCFDVMEATIDATSGNMLFQNGADLYFYDRQAQTSRPLDIYVSTDFDQRRTRWETAPQNYLTTSSLSPKGTRVALTARGQVFAAPASSLLGTRIPQVTRNGGLGRYREATFVDDDTILALCDETGELEFYMLPADGIGPGVRLTNDRGATVSVYSLAVAPAVHDGVVWVSYTDTDFRLIARPLSLTSADDDTNSRENMVVVSDLGTYGSMEWSHDGLWLAYTKNEQNQMASIHLFSAESGVDAPVTSDHFNSFSPTFSKDDSFLYFLTDRAIAGHLGSVWGDRQQEAFLLPSTQVFCIPLRPYSDPVPPFVPANEVIVEYIMAGGLFSSSNDSSIVVEGAIERTMHVDFIPTGRYTSLSMVSGEQLLVQAISFTDNPLSQLRYILFVSLQGRYTAILNDYVPMSSFEVSANGARVLLRRSGNHLSILAVSDGSLDMLKDQIDLSTWRLQLDPQKEWRQMLEEAWRLMRDYFYDPSMHGTNWPAIRDKYLPLVNRVSTRDELDDVIGQVVGELSALHVFVYGGDYRALKSSDVVPLGYLGATLARNTECARCSGADGDMACECGYVVEHIFRGSPEYPDKTPPILSYSPFGAVEEGDLILAIDGVPLSTVAHPNELLAHKDDSPVHVLFGDAKDPTKVWPSIIQPMDGGTFSDLRYDEWEYDRQQRVETLGDGRIGYVHLRAMSTGSWERWVRAFYPVYTREGLIVDVRHNRGGNIDSWILEKLMRPSWMFWQGRYGDESKQASWNMQYAFRGYIVVLCDEHTASDGEAFSEGFKRLGLGTVIGTRTWGGEIWLSSDNRLVDHGIASAPETGVYDLDGNWLIENHGVEPDIEVDNLPHETFNGKDRQLESAVQHILDKLREKPIIQPVAPAYPNKAVDGCYERV